MRVTVVHPDELGETELERWRSLQRADAELNNPFLAPEFTQAVAGVRDNVRVAVIEDGGEYAGFFPFERHALGVGRPVAGLLSTCQGIVTVPDLRIDARFLLRQCGLSVFEFDHLIAGQKAFAEYETGTAPSPIMDLREGSDSYLAALRKSNPKVYKTAMYKRRKLGREHGEIRFAWETSDSDALRHVIAWKSDQYLKIGRSDRFARPWVVRLVQRLQEMRSPGFAGTVAMLYVGERPIAGHFGLRTDHTLAGLFPAYDPEFARYSPGVIQKLSLAEAAAEAGLSWIDMGKGAQPYKEWLQTGELRVADACVLRPSPASALYWLHHEPVRRVRNRILNNPALYARADQALRRYGRVRAALRPKRNPAHR